MRRTDRTAGWRSRSPSKDFGSLSMAEPRRSLRVAVVCAVLAVLGATGRVRAEILVSLQYESKAELEHARRVASELASEGYTVETGSIPELSACNPCSSKPRRARHDPRANSSRSLPPKR